MKYTLFLNKQADNNWRAVVPALPRCEVEAPTRQEALTQIQEIALRLFQQTEILSINLPNSTVQGDVEGEFPTLEEIVAQIRATSPNPAYFHPATGSLAEYLQEHVDDPTFDAHAWDQEWAEIESELKRINLTKSRRELFDG